jgi:hypothetical protein
MATAAILKNIVGISTVVCGSFLGVEKIQNGCHCHGNQGTKWPPKYKNPLIWAKKEFNNFLNPPFFVSMATAAKFVQPIPIFFGLSRSTRCGCCSYQVSSIYVRRVTSYAQFCVFQETKNLGFKKYLEDSFHQTS